MTQKDRIRALYFITRIFYDDPDEVSDEEKDKFIGKLALLDIDTDEYKDIVKRIDEIMMKKRLMYAECRLNLLKSVIRDDIS